MHVRARRSAQHVSAGHSKPVELNVLVAPLAAAAPAGSLAAQSTASPPHDVLADATRAVKRTRKPTSRHTLSTFTLGCGISHAAPGPTTAALGTHAQLSAADGRQRQPGDGEGLLMVMLVISTTAALPCGSVTLIVTLAVCLASLPVRRALCAAHTLDPDCVAIDDADGATTADAQSGGSGLTVTSLEPDERLPLADSVSVTLQLMGAAIAVVSTSLYEEADA